MTQRCDKLNSLLHRLQVGAVCLKVAEKNHQDVHPSKAADAANNGRVSRLTVLKVLLISVWE